MQVHQKLQEEIEKEKKFAREKKMELLIGGDFNCRLKSTEEYKSVVGIYATVVKMSENGDLLTEMAISCGLRVENTFYRKDLARERAGLTQQHLGGHYLISFLLKEIELIGSRTSEATQDLTVVPTTIW